MLTSWPHKVVREGEGGGSRAEGRGKENWAGNRGLRPDEKKIKPFSFI